MSIQKYKRISITIEKRLLEEFQKYCNNEGMNISSRIGVLIKKDLEKKR